MCQQKQSIMFFLLFFIFYGFTQHTVCDQQQVKYYSQVGQDEYMHKNIFSDKKRESLLILGQMME